MADTEIHENEHVVKPNALKDAFFKAVYDVINTKRSNARLLDQTQHNKRIQDLINISIHGRKSCRDFDIYKRFELQACEGELRIYKKGTERQIVSVEDSFDIIHDAHMATDHGGRDVIIKYLAGRYANVTYEVVQLYLNLCESCKLKKPNTHKGPSKNWHSRCQVDLIDMQSRPDREYKFILVYQDHLTKFCVLKPTKSKTAIEVAECLVDIFCLMGAPYILQSDNGKEFEKQVVREVRSLWPECKLIHGKPKHSQSQGSVERCSRDVEIKLACWMKDNATTEWAKGLRFVQLSKNTRIHSEIGCSPFEALYSYTPTIGVANLNTSKTPLSRWDSEGDIEMDEVSSYEISLCEVAGMSSASGQDQGCIKCNCKTQCQTKRCRCLSLNVKCNSKCHSSLSCCNI